MNNSSSAHIRLTRGPLLAKNVFLNFLGSGIPLLAAIYAIPKLIAGIGTPRFGLLTLVWVVIGYFSLFDLGLGRALTKVTSDKLGEGRNKEIPSIAWTALTIMFVMGLIAALIFCFSLPFLVHHILKIPDDLKEETLKSCYWAAASIPIVISTSGLRGLLEAYQRFDLLMAIRIPMGVFNFLSPLLVLPFSRSLYPIVVILVAGRVIGWVVHFLLCSNVIPAFYRQITIRYATVKPLIALGSWMTISSIIGPLMLYFDRFLIAAVLSVTAVAYYSTPYEMITKLLMGPMALMAVLFPAFAASVAQNRARTGRLFNQGVNCIFLTMLPICLFIVTLAPEILTLWLGKEFASQSSFVFRCLSAGVFFNGLAFVAFGLIQGAGRPDLTAKLHISEFIIYLPVLWLLLNYFGINGAAVAWTVRMAIDMGLLFWMASKLVPETSQFIKRNVVIMAIAIMVFIIAGWITELFIKIIFIILISISIIMTALFVYIPRLRLLLR